MVEFIFRQHEQALSFGLFLHDFTGVGGFNGFFILSGRVLGSSGTFRTLDERNLVVDERIERQLGRRGLGVGKDVDAVELVRL